MKGSIEKLLEGITQHHFHKEKQIFSVSIKEIQSLTNKLPIKTVTDPEVSTDYFYQKFKEEMITILYNLSQKIEAKGTPPNSFSVR